MALLDQVFKRLRTDYAAAGKQELFELLEGNLTGGKRRAPNAEVAAKTGMTENAVKMAVSRMRKRYGELLRREIADTVATPEQVDDELRHLFSAL